VTKLRGKRPKLSCRKPVNNSGQLPPLTVINRFFLISNPEVSLGQGRCGAVRGRCSGPASGGPLSTSFRVRRAAFQVLLPGTKTCRWFVGHLVSTFVLGILYGKLQSTDNDLYSVCLRGVGAPLLTSASFYHVELKHLIFLGRRTDHAGSVFVEEETPSCRSDTSGGGGGAQGKATSPKTRSLRACWPHPRSPHHDATDGWQVARPAFRSRGMGSGGEKARAAVGLRLVRGGLGVLAQLMTLYDSRSYNDRRRFWERTRRREARLLVSKVPQGPA